MVAVVLMSRYLQGNSCFAMGSLFSTSSVMYHSASEIMPACLEKVAVIPGQLEGAKTLHVSES